MYYKVTWQQFLIACVSPSPKKAEKLQSLTMNLQKKGERNSKRASEDHFIFDSFFLLRSVRIAEARGEKK